MGIILRPELKKKLQALPAQPGVYFHKDKNGEVIYVGKAAILKNRVRQYFRSYDSMDVKTKALVAEIYDVDWMVVGSEMDALFLESEMIKRYKPRWNILLRDDKTVTYVRINMNDEVPYVTMTRNPEDDGAEYLGPYYGKTAISRALRALRRVFPYYDKAYTGKKNLDTDLGLNPGIEIDKTSIEDYKSNLRQIIGYLKGYRKALVIDIENKMKRAAKAQDFEAALKYRNQLYGLRGLSTKIVFSDQEFLDVSNDLALKGLQRILRLENLPRRIEGYDISHQSGQNVVGSMVVFINGVAERNEYRRFKLKKQQNDDVASMREVLSRRLKHLKTWGRPDLILLDGGVQQLSAILELVQQAGEDIAIIARDKSGQHSKSAAVKIVIKQGGGYETVALPKDGHVAKLIARIDEESHRFAVQYHRLLKHKEFLS